MKLFNDTWIRVLLPAALIMLSFVAQQVFLPPFNNDKLLLALKIFLFVSLSFEICRLLIFGVRRKMPGAAETKKRVLVTYLICLLACFLMISISTLINQFYFHHNVDLLFESLINLMQCVLLAFIISGPYEVLYSYSLLLKSEKEKDELLRANLQSRFETLKSQVNPHFLFNSLNTLSSLIAKDPVKAEEFVLEMSSVYRYLLRNNEEQLVTLGSELELINSFFHLLETRYGQALQVEVKVAAGYGDYLIPPLTLQMLIENAVKHNVVAEDEPLCIGIYSNDSGKLVIKNNLRKKTQHVISEKVGLSNIISRYQLLKQPDVEIRETENEFIVIVPLIKKELYENSDR